MRHVEREIDITAGVHHRRSVATIAVFELSSNAFVSVMPYCNGGSLDDLLGAYQALASSAAAVGTDHAWALRIATASAFIVDASEVGQLSHSVAVSSVDGSWHQPAEVVTNLYGAALEAV